MPRGIFISFHHRNVNQARGFTLLHHNKGVNLRFRGKHFIDPVKSQNEKYIWHRIIKAMHGTSVTVILLGSHTYKSEWVADEIKASVERGNGVVAIKLKDQDCPLPPTSPVGQALADAAAEVVGWQPSKFDAAIERAAKGAKRRTSTSATSNSSSGTCSR